MGCAQAQLWLGGEDFATVDVGFPELADGELLLRMNVATVCGSDRHTVAGRRSSPAPSILGHEGIGTVITSRRGGIGPGQRVVFSVTAPCRECSRCLAGFTAKCVNVRKVGHEPYRSSWPLSGTYASHIHLLRGQEVVPVPDGVQDAHASVAGCAISTVMAVFESAGDVSGRKVIVNGLGMLGLAAVAEARSRGASEVVGCDPKAASRELASGMADGVSPSAEGMTADVVLELSGARTGVAHSLAACDVGGTVVLAGSVTPVGNVEVDPERLVRGWRTITGVHNYEPRHLGQAMDFVQGAGKLLPWDELLGGPVDLAGLPREFSRGSRGLRTVVHC